MEPLLHVQQLVDLAFQQTGDRDARPLGDHLRHVLGVDLFLENIGPWPSAAAAWATSASLYLRVSSGIVPY